MLTNASCLVVGLRLELGLDLEVSGLLYYFMLLSVVVVTVPLLYRATPSCTGK